MLLQKICLSVCVCVCRNMTKLDGAPVMAQLATWLIWAIPSMNIP